MTTVQILGIDGSPDTRKMRANVKLALASLGMKAVVENVTKVEDLVKFKINGIPALVVNGTVVLQKKVPDTEDLKAMLKVFIDPAINQFDMKKLIVPTDFSSTAENAFQFALSLGALHQGNLKAIHVFSPEFDAQNPYLGEPVNLLEDSMNGQLEAFVGQAEQAFSKGSVPPIERETIIGFPAEEIIRISGEEKPDMIIMGATGEKGLFEKVFGSISVAVAQKAKCPVLLVPEGSVFNGFKQILYASDFENLSETTLQKLINIAGTFNAGIHFVHVESQDSQQDFKEIENSLFKVLFKNGEPTFSFTMSKVKGNSVADGLHQYALGHQIDMVVLVHPHRNLWDSLFKRSVTKDMAFNPKLPVLVLHEN
ncbi:MAG: universal stress protein [Lewinellaceae bacterium]|nr:universal stress protein [Saprospiraceae bacterium]MCB9340513.1 universal stress protein [Lewinellaceae bacterium]